LRGLTCAERFVRGELPRLCGKLVELIGAVEEAAVRPSLGRRAASFRQTVARCAHCPAFASSRGLLSTRV
jgi:hypothetical protein